MNRSIFTTTNQIEPLTLPVDSAMLRAWLVEQARKYDLHWLLAHAEDGVIWGDVRESGLELSCEAFPLGSLALRYATLLECRLFGIDAELLIWQGPAGLAARLQRDGVGDQQVDCIDERYLLWGDEAEGAARNGFLPLAEGAQGIHHAPPIAVQPVKQRSRALHCARLGVRHYLAADEAGIVRISASRLTRLIAPGEK